MKRTHKQTLYAKGLRGEWIALCLLRLKGYQLLARRLKTPFGEIDLLMRRGQMLIVVEVKARPTREQGLEALTKRSQKRLKNALRFALTRWPEYGCLDLRFDLIVVQPWRIPLHFSHVIG